MPRWIMIVVAVAGFGAGWIARDVTDSTTCVGEQTGLGADLRSEVRADIGADLPIADATRLNCD